MNQLDKKIFFTEESRYFENVSEVGDEIMPEIMVKAKFVAVYYVMAD